MQEKIIHQVHDKFFRTVMGDKRVARAFLNAHLPADLLQITNLDHLELQPRSYINDVRKESIVDVLFKTTISEKEAYLYLLVEHQSEPDALMPFRLLKYTVNILDDFLAKTHKKTLPLIYPMVIYHADKSYRYSTDIRDIVDAPRALIDRYFLKPFHLIDLGKITDAEIKRHAWAGVMEFALKHIFERDVLPWMKDKEITVLMRHIVEAGGKKYVEIVLEYIMERGELSSKDEFIHLINQEISKEVGEKIMSLAERIRIEGMQQGMQQGIEKRNVDIAKRLLSEGAELAFIAKITELPIETLQELKNKSH